MSGYNNAPVRAPRNRKPPDLFSVPVERQVGFRRGSAVEIAALDAGRDIRQDDDAAAPADSPQFHAGAPGARGGRARGRARGRGRGRGRARGGDDASPPAPAAAAGAPSTALPARAVAANHLRLYMDRDRATAPQFKLRTGSRVCRRYKEFNAWTDKDTLYDLLFSVYLNYTYYINILGDAYGC